MKLHKSPPFEVHFTCTTGISTLHYGVHGLTYKQLKDHSLQAVFHFYTAVMTLAFV